MERVLARRLPKISSQESSQESSQKIVMLMKMKPTITIKELAQNIGLSTRAIQKHIQKLQSNNKIRRVGSTKSGVWEITTPSV